jgi:arginyl-tRNA synthetase
MGSRLTRREANVLRDQIAKMLEDGLRSAQKAGDLPKFDLPPVVIERPKQAEYGDYSSPVCMGLARYARMAPIEIAQRLLKRVKYPPPVGAVEAVHPGYINVRLDPAWIAAQVDVILAAGETWGAIDLGHGRRVQVEFGSANPTGPLHVGFGRNVVLGDTIASVLEAAGYDVQREYYINDAGTQMRLFAESLYARYAQALGQDLEFPSDGYRGQYLVEWGQQVASAEGDRFLNMDREDALRAIGDLGLEEKILPSVRRDVALLNIHYDRWFHERSLYQNYQFATIMRLLRESDDLVERDGAVWFPATRYGDQKDEVVVRSTGEPGYFASDIAYHYNKFVERGFEWVIDVWGADHQGHVPRMKAMMEALDLDPDRLTLVVYQLVTVKEGGEDVRLSKRAGTLVHLHDLLEDVGPDAVRFFLASRDPDSQMEFDLDLAREQSDKNPVYYVQYGHARIASILRNAVERGWDVETDEGDLSPLKHESELNLIRKMLTLEEVIELAAINLQPHHLTYYAQELASDFHTFYRDCRVLSSDPADAELTKARLKLVRAAKGVLARVLGLMGMSAPERM